MDRTVDPMVGRTIGGVAIERKLGAGGMAAVYAGRDEEAGGAARAIKVLSVASPESHQVRFDREARIGRMLDHPLVVRVHRHGTCGDFRYMVMDLIDGEDLARVLRRTGPMHWPVVTTLGRDLAQALAHAHERGIVHRDVKPQNVLVDAALHLKLADFGLAHWRDGPPDLAGGASLTATGDAFGTPAYMAPEQFRDAKSVGPAADLYALGIVLFEGLAGRVPFHASSPVDLARLHRDVPPPSLEALAAEAPDALRDLIARLLEKDHLRRPSSAREVARELELIAAHGPTSTNLSSASGRRSAVPSARGVAETQPPRRRRVRAALFGLGAVAAGLLGWGVATGKLERRVRFYLLAGPEERARLEAIRDARDNVAQDPRALVEAIDAYLRDFGTGGWLLEPVLAFKSRPHRRGGNVYLLVPDRAEMVHVPGGTYRVGAPGGDDRAVTRPREVRLGGFLIDRHEVCNERYERFLARWHAAGDVHLCGNERADHDAALARSMDPHTGRSPYPDGPIVGVTPWDALEYARFYGRRLPSEAEWEVAAAWDPAARAARPYPWGEQTPGPERPSLANLAFGGWGAPGPDGAFMALCSPMGFYDPDVSPFGLVDAGGNAAEWCTGDKPLPGRQPVRGGSILTDSADRARLVARREHDPREAPPPDVGFRTVMAYEGPEE
ncbi:MAG: SUMF1/EgtB/PvdO family nonheme iron enzyme [Planctomycetes bacterium]|nr:SUMF1/EgtB/PvdO family nonheme iron enzyme [Planctomycetota bacterium]